MTIHTLCNSCLQVYALQIGPEDSHLVQGLLDDDQTCPCPRLCGGRIILTTQDDLKTLASDGRLYQPLPITGRELFKAVKGVGLPDEIPSSLEAVEALLLSKHVVSVSMQQDGRRIYLHELRLSNGVVLHLAAGQRGAQVLKITRERVDAEVPQAASGH